MSNKVLVNCSHGKDDVERATVAFIVASAASTTGETAMFLTAHAVGLATKGGADGVQADKYPPIKQLIDAIVENGGKLWVCPACASARGITPDQLIAGAEIAGAARTIGFVNDGARTLM
ncbi:MAG: hypothetical protein F9K29_17945 [Hyphomicrobiaceae bacterium]|nr:MAG: hypothetical protein F9K29_17945 [Hyphomicrobiaceae bacterium]